MVYTLLIIIGLVGLIIASIADILTREVPDWLNYSLIAFGLGFRAIISLSTSEFTVFLYALLGLIIAFLIGTLMYYLKQWGGGDAKTFMAVAALFTTMPNQEYFLLNFTINLLILGALYATIYSFFLYIKNKAKVDTKVKDYFSRTIKTRSIILIIVVLFSSILYYIDKLYFILSVAIVLLVSLYLFILPLIKITEHVSLIKMISVKKLTEGDWITKSIRVKNRLIYNKKSPGVTSDQIRKILKLGIKKIEVREGIPFIPSFLLALIFTLIFRNIISYVI